MKSNLLFVSKCGNLRGAFLIVFFFAFSVLYSYAADESVTFSDNGYTNQEAVESYAGTDFTITFDKGTNSNAPKYFTSGTAIRCYGGNSFTISSTTKTIVKIELSFASGEGSNAITTNVDTYNNGTWEGSATSITFTIGGTSGHRRIASVAVTFASGTATTYTATWYVNGSPVHSQTAAANTTLTAPDDEPTSSDCDEAKEFVGWTDTEITGSTNTKPADLFSDPTTKKMPASDIDYYAVFATASSGDGTTTSTFVASEQDYSDGDDASVKVIDGVTYTWDGAKYYNSGSSVRVYNNNTLTISSENTITTIDFTYSQKAFNSASVGTVDTDGNWSGSASSVTFTNTHGTGSSNQVHISQIVVAVGGGTTYSAYQTSCTPLTSHTITIVNGANGNYSINPNTAVTSAMTAVLTVTPDQGYTSSASVTSGTAQISKSGNVYTITNVTSDITITIAYATIPTYTVTLIDNGTTRATESVEENGTYELPADGLSECVDAKFLGWAASSFTNGTTKPTVVSGEQTITGNTTYYAVYQTTEQGEDDWTQMTSTDILSAGDKIVIVPVGDTHAMYQETVSSSYVNYWSFNASEIDNDDKNWFTVTESSTTGEWYLGDATNGYLNNSSSNNLEVNTSGSKSSWEIEWNSTGSGFTFQSNLGRYLACRADLSGGNQYKYRMNGEVISATNGSLYYFDLYKTGGSTIYTNRPQCCTPPTNKLQLEASATTIIGSGTITLSLTGGNGKDISWTADGGTLSGMSNSGATITLPQASETKTYTIAASQEDDDTDPDNVVCGATQKVVITVKAQYTITYKVIVENVEEEFSSITVVDGADYTLPDLSEDFTCPDGIAFAGWASSATATAVEKTAGTTITADNNKTWWAVWGASSGTSETVDLYQEVTDISQISAGDKVIIASASVWKAMSTDQRTNNRGSATTYEYETDDTKTYFLSTDAVQVFTLGGNSSDGWSFFDGSKYIYAASSSSNYLKSQTTNDDNGLWTISISGSVATITANGTNTHNLLQYNNSSDIFSCYGSAQTKGGVMLYRRTGETATIVTSSSSSVTTNTTCVSGATIRAIGNSWITSAQGQKVKTVYQIVAKGFETAQTLSITSNTDPTHFSASLAATAIPQEPSQLETTLTIEYTPTESNTHDQTTITLTAGDVTRTITINGRSVPQEFVLITKKGNWYALPANMSQAGQHDGINVVPDDAANPTQVPVASASALYSLKSVATSRYASAGGCVRLVGNDNKCLWATSTSGATDIRNYAALGETNGAQYEWNLYTENGTTYTITSPQHPDTEGGRKLAYGARFGLYKQESEFYILPVGCSAQPENVEVSPAREQVTISFESNATELVVNIYDADDNSLVATATVNSSPVTIPNLKEMHEYTYEIIPDGNNDCKVGDEFTTTGPSVDVVEWMENAVIIYVDKDEDLHPKVIVDGQEEHGSISSGTVANELFFAKYFEGAGTMKLISIFNGTVNDIDLDADAYNIHYICVGNGNNQFSPQSDKNYPLGDLGTIKSGQEIIFFTGPQESDLQECSNAFLDSVALLSGEDNNPRWIKCDGQTSYGNTKYPKFDFSGNDILVLQKGGTDIDVFGAKNAPPASKNCRGEDAWAGTAINMDYGKSPNDPIYKPLFDASSHTPTTDAERIDILRGFGVDLENEIINITTARCILFRNKSVKDGFDAVNNNTDDFSTFTEAEWNGRSVCMTNPGNYNQAGVTNDAKATCNSYQDIGKFDYSTYYIDEVTIIPSEELDTYGWKPEENLYKIDIDNLEKYTCLFLTFQLTDDDGNIITSQRKQVPILVKSANATTDELFYNIIDNDYENSKKRCSTCDVVVMRDAVLTKATAGAEHDVNKVNNIQVYPGGKLIVPAAGNDYQINSLCFRREEDNISAGDIQGDLTVKQTNGVYLDVRIDPSNWHWLSLPFDCNVADVKFSNGESAKYNTDWFLMYYDGQQRAATQTGGCWKVYEEPVIHAGQGLIVGIQGLSDKPKVKLELRFPMANDVIAAELQNKTLDVYAWGLGGEGIMGDTKPQEHFGWNLVGNPYMNYYRKGNLNSFNGLTLGKLILDTEGHDTYYNNGDGIAYVAVPINGGWTAYEQKPVAGNDLLPFTSYFVQVGTETNTADEQLTVLFDHTNRGKSSMIRRVVEEQETPAFVGIYLTAANGERDETALVVSDRFHDHFEIGKDMYKWFGDYYKYYSKPVVYTISPDHKLAFNALPEASAAAQVPVGFYAAANGNYTFALNRNSDLQRAEEVWLFDAQENTYTNLMQENYQFYTTKQQNENRFFLSVKLTEKQDDTPTNLPDSKNADIKVTTSVGSMTLTGLPVNAHVWIYSTNGSLLVNQTTDSWQQTYHLPAGVYNIRVVAQEAVTLRGIVK